jgi:inner membrane protein
MRFPLLTKVLAIGLVITVLSVVLLRIDWLVVERRGRQAEAVASVEESHAGAQTLLGPLLHRSCVEEWDSTTGEGKDRRAVTERREFGLMAVPQSLQVVSQANAEARYRGLFKVNGYGGSSTLVAQWNHLQALQPQRQQASSRIGCGPAVLMVALSDVRGVRSAKVLLDEQATTVLPGTLHGRHAKGFHVELPAARTDDAARPLVAKVELDLMGTARLALVPAAQDTSWALRSDWPHPSFGGRFLPAKREVDEAGFVARWAVSSLASSAAADVQAQGEVCAWAGQMSAYRHRGGDDDGGDVSHTERGPSAQGRSCLETLSVSFIDPVNPYVLTDRATKYALLFIVLTFTCVFLVEMLSRRRVHPVQYALVGLALALFYLLLLSLSEHLRFGLAYGAASAGCVALLGFYAMHMLGSRGAGLGFGAGVAGLYGLLWVLLQMEQTALVIGSLVLFAALAAVMVATRRIDWYGVFDSGRRPSAAHGEPGA